MKVDVNQTVKFMYSTQTVPFLFLVDVVGTIVAI